MFRQLRNSLVGQPRFLIAAQPLYVAPVQPPPPPNSSDGVLSDFRPSQLLEYLEQFWNTGLLFNVAPFPAAPPDIPAHFVGEGLAIPGTDGERQLMARNIWLQDGNLPGAAGR